MGSSSRLGSLTQAARSKQLNFGPIDSFCHWNLDDFGLRRFIFLTKSQVETMVSEQIGKLPPGAVADPVKVQELEHRLLVINYVIRGIGLLLGGVFVILGLIVKQFPVPITIIGLVLYIGSFILFAVIYGLLGDAGSFTESLTTGIPVKIIIIISLAKAIQAALAYERERNAAVPVEAEA